MKLITETTEQVNFLTELNEETGKKSYFIEGPFLQSNITNRNGRMYPKEIMQKEVVRYTKENIDKKTCLRRARPS